MSVQTRFVCGAQAVDVFVEVVYRGSHGRDYRKRKFDVPERPSTWYESVRVVPSRCASRVISVPINPGANATTIS